MIRRADSKPVARIEQPRPAARRPSWFVRHGGWVVGLGVATAAIVGAAIVAGQRRRRERGGELNFCNWTQVRRSPSRQQFHRETEQLEY